MIELNCETDFVAKNEDFQTLADKILRRRGRPRSLLILPRSRRPRSTVGTVDEAVLALSARIGEKLELRRVVQLDGQVALYLHRRSVRPAAASACSSHTTATDAEAARGAAMQIAALRPRYLTREDVPADVVENERRIAEANAREEGKPEQALAAIVEGRLNGFYKDDVLLEQASVHEPKKTVKALLDEAGVTVTGSPASRSARPDRRRPAVDATGPCDGGAAGSDRGSHGGARRSRRARRVLLKLGGEMFGGGAVGVDPDVVAGRGPADRRGRQRRRRRSRSSSAAATSSAAPSCPSAAWTAPAPTTWACSAPS